MWLIPFKKEVQCLCCCFFFRLFFALDCLARLAASSSVLPTSFVCVVRCFILECRSRRNATPSTL